MDNITFSENKGLNYFSRNWSRAWREKELGEMTGNEGLWGGCRNLVPWNL